MASLPLTNRIQRRFHRCRGAGHRPLPPRHFRRHRTGCFDRRAGRRRCELDQPHHGLPASVPSQIALATISIFKLRSKASAGRIPPHETPCQPRLAFSDFLPQKQRSAGRRRPGLATTRTRHRARASTGCRALPLILTGARRANRRSGESATSGSSRMWTPGRRPPPSTCCITPKSSTGSGGWTKARPPRTTTLSNSARASRSSALPSPASGGAVIST
jgi:hypothetical protein